MLAGSGLTLRKPPTVVLNLRESDWLKRLLYIPAVAHDPSGYLSPPVPI